jgi:lipopolysaccharide export system protein LptA
MSARKKRLRIVMRAAVAGAAALLVVLPPALRAGAAEDQEAVRPVELGRRPIEITADRLNADSATDSVTFEGNVVAIYNQEQRIVLTGGAELEQGENTLKGDTVTIYLRENRSVITGGKGGRVRAVLHPQGLLEGKGKEDR